MSLKANAIVTLAQAREYVKMPAADTSKDSILTDFINAGSDMIETLIGDPVVPIDNLEYSDGSGGSYLYPSGTRIIRLVGADLDEQLGNLQARSGYDKTWKNLFTAANQFAIIGDPSKKNYREKIMRLDGKVFPYGRRNIRIFYTEGFSAIPEGIIQCAREMVETLWLDSPHGNTNLVVTEITDSFQGGGSHTIKLKTMSKRWEELLCSYIREGKDAS